MAWHPVAKRNVALSILRSRHQRQATSISHSFFTTSGRLTAMRSCSGARVTWKRAGPLTSIARRCKSYDQARYNEEYWLGKVQEGLGNRPDSPRVDSTTNSVRTAAGDLPLSPVFDPKWISNKTRKTKAKKAAASGRFQSKVYNNIYGRCNPIEFHRELN